MKNYLLIASLAWPVLISAQLVLDASDTPENYVQNIFVGAGVAVSNVTFKGNPGNVVDPNAQIASFDASMANIGIASGLLLCSGDANVALGPNDNMGATLPAGGYNSSGDPDLDIISGTSTFDAAYLEFDFVPSNDSLLFRFSFASEEYVEYVGFGVNDPFGLFISGPGITGPYSGGAENIALLPGTTIPVTIDNVNDVTNSQYFIDNGAANMSNPPFSTDPAYIQFDGFTTVLTAVAEVQCGETYHLKIAVSDALDAILDSGVFLEAGSLSSPGTFSLNVNAVAGSANGAAVEGCFEGELLLVRPDTAGMLNTNLDITGTAINGVDFDLINLPVIFPAGVDTIILPIVAIEDNMNEGPETITFSSWFVNGCGDTTYVTEALTIEEHQPIIINALVDQFLDCTQDSVLLTASAVGGFGTLTYNWGNGTVGPNTYVPGLIDGGYSVTVSDECDFSETSIVQVYAGCAITIPNVFSPNVDGSNDSFVIQGIEGKRSTVRIFNRWGNVIFEQKNYRNTWRAQGVVDGVYFYEIIVDGESKPFTGQLSILR